MLGRLFRKALELNRPSFVDYILRCGYDARQVCDVSIDDTSASTKDVEEIEQDPIGTTNDTTVCQQFILNLYNYVKNNPYEVS